MNQSRGFTLLEVLIATVMTALIGLAAFQASNIAITTNKVAEAQMEDLASLQRAMFIINRDFQQAVSRPIRDQFGDLQAAMLSSSDLKLIEFSRQGWRNPLEDNRSELQRVAYVLDDQNLLRAFWRVMDRAQDSDPREQKLMENVESIDIAYLNASNEWVNDWPPDAEPVDDEQKGNIDSLESIATLPKGLRLTIKHGQYGELERLFDFTAYVPGQAFPEPDEDEGEGDGENDGNSNGGVGDIIDGNLINGGGNNNDEDSE